MSSILTVYRMAESRRLEFENAYADEKKVSYKSGFFGKKEIVTGELFLWEYLDQSALQRIDFEYSGFLFIDYFFSFVVFPEDIQLELNASARGEHYHALDSTLARKIRAFLLSNTPSHDALSLFANEENNMEPGYPEALLSTHNQLIQWLDSCTDGSFIVIHLTF